MLGRILALAAAVSLAACARNVKQDAKTGADGKWKGAKAVTIEQNEGETSGIVTYPGGDRVDWKLIELPDGKQGTVELTLSWKPPRPGLDLAFDVYDEWGTKVGGVKPKKPSATKKSKKKRGKKSTTLSNVKGKLYVEVYASNRGDAGKYKLHVAFTEAVAADVIDISKLDVPEPPKLAAVPPPCDPMNIDEKNPECKGVTKPCDPKNYDPNNPACATVCPDPKKPDKEIEACIKYFPACDPENIDKENPRCTGVTAPKKPQPGFITSVEVQSGGTVIQINRGLDAGVDKGWTGEIVDSSGKTIKDGTFTIFKAQKTRSFAKVKLSREVVNKNLNVKLYPP